MVRVGLVGLGKMGMSHLAIVNSHPQASVAVVCDSSRYQLDVLRRYTRFQCVQDFSALLNEYELDAAIISVPSRFHGQYVRQALESGLHVFCEKPFCLEPSESHELSRLASDKGLINQVGYHCRYVSTFQEVRRLVSLGVIGRICHLRIEAYGPVVVRPQGRTWRSSAGEGGGCLYDYASHAVDLGNFIVGPPDGIVGATIGRIFSQEVDDEVYALMDYGNGMTGELAANWSDESHRKMTLKVILWGTEGKLVADRQELQLYLKRPRPSENLKGGWNTFYATSLAKSVWYYLRGEEYSAQIDQFICSIGSSTASISSFQTAAQTDEVIAMIKAACGHVPSRRQ